MSTVELNMVRVRLASNFPSLGLLQIALQRGYLDYVDNWTTDWGKVYTLARDLTLPTGCRIPVDVAKHLQSSGWPIEFLDSPTEPVGSQTQVFMEILIELRAIRAILTPSADSK